MMSLSCIPGSMLDIGIVSDVQCHLKFFLSVRLKRRTVPVLSGVCSKGTSVKMKRPYPAIHVLVCLCDHQPLRVAALSQNADQHVFVTALKRIIIELQSSHYSGVNKNLLPKD